MTPNKRHNQRSSVAFTLLELVLFIAIFALMAGALVPLLSSNWEHDELRDSAEQLAIYARTARASAVLQGKPASVTFFPHGFALTKAQPSPSLDQGNLEEDPFTDPFDDLYEEEEIVTYDETYELAEDIKLKVRRWNSDEWIIPEEARWVFQSSGLNEPVVVNLSLGEAWIELEFSPLTAEVADERYYFP